ncbi:DUF2187 domain-containing protein [Robertmurraya yapensis]|uniref:DUF2187 domain-containing protein n=2 Tax=Bacillaceae TaxID=186817 RepID=A0A3S0I3F8_9BACI|nr:MULTISPECIES: DUF2187 family protein [Bacillaceae]RTR26560.1 DUF2187 domain-containing protein [Bacillus yapensis]TKC15061.1 DUF2187 domain-containing protein [Robertmurraya kyonggiensis]TKS93735.1 DUF2187 domain-containing protein [Bacillus yapensis]
MSTKAKIGDTIQFSRKGITVEGNVTMIRENSVLVEISLDSSKELNLENTRTIVNHSKYKVLSKQ